MKIAPKLVLNLLSTPNISVSTVQELLNSLEGTPFWLAASRIVASSYSINQDIASMILKNQDPYVVRELARNVPFLVRNLEEHLTGLSLEDWIWIVSTSCWSQKNPKNPLLKQAMEMLREGSSD